MRAETLPIPDNFSFPKMSDVARINPCARHLNVRRTLQSGDGIFSSHHGAASMVSLERIGNGSNPDGFLATVTLAVDPEATPAPVNGFGPGRGGPRGSRPFER